MTTYEYKKHSFIPLTGVGKQYCYRCGLVALNNPLTDWCVAKGCYHDDHPAYKSQVKKLGGKRNDK